MSGVTAGTVLGGEFKILERLSSGGMGTVYVAEQLSTGGRRAVKVMRPELLSTPRLRERFEQEARIGGRIESEHVVQIISAGVDEATATPYFAMELLDGRDLLDHVRHHGPIASGELVSIVEQICHGVSAAHRLGIIHRDLKPENIFLSKSRRARVPFMVKVLDFGVAKVVAEASAGTGAVGTPFWMAPEQAEVRGGRIGPRTDIWALGLIAFFALTGKIYWLTARDPKVQVALLLRELLMAPIAPPSVRARELGVEHPLPPGFDAWFAKCVTREPIDRFESVELLEAELCELLGLDPNRVAEKRRSIAMTTLDRRATEAPAEMPTNVFLDQIVAQVHAPAAPMARAPTVPPAPPPPFDDYPPLSEPQRISTAPDHGPISTPPPTQRDSAALEEVRAIVEARAGAIEEQVVPTPTEAKRDRWVVWGVLATLVVLGVIGAILGLMR
ncbi:MAG: serine/threonine-protein kinase [Polyangiaceae bacterium]